MSNVLTQNNIRYSIDSVDLSSGALIRSKANNFLDCTNVTDVLSFNIDYKEPAGSQIALAFCFTDESTWFRLKDSSTRVNLETQNMTYETLIEEGNSPQELATLQDITLFVGKKIRVAIALTSTDAANYRPQIKIGLNLKFNDIQYTKEIESSPLYFADNAGQVISLEPDFETAQNGNISLEAKIDDGQYKSWEQVIGQEGSYIQFRATMNAPVVGTSYALMKSVKIGYNKAGIVYAGPNESEIVTQTQNFYKPVRHCRMQIRHAPLNDSYLKAYASFRNSGELIENEFLGYGNGQSTTYQLKNSERVDFKSVKIYFDGKQILTGYSVNSEVGRVTLTAPLGTNITADYTHLYGLEEWVELKFQSLIRKENYDQSEYIGSITTGQPICCAKIILGSSNGSVLHEELGEASAAIPKVYKLEHKVREGKISIYDAQGNQIPDSNIILMEDPQYVKVAANNSTTLTASYEWISESPVVYSFHAVFSDDDGNVQYGYGNDNNNSGGENSGENSGDNSENSGNTGQDNSETATDAEVREILDAIFKYYNDLKEEQDANKGNTGNKDNDNNNDDDDEYASDSEVDEMLRDIFGF